jgi:ABC-type taurine transport system substrate-binding protein
MTGIEQIKVDPSEIVNGGAPEVVAAINRRDIDMIYMV